ncbi:MAG: hypothetical protein ACOCVF_00255 [bacterium]
MSLYENTGYERAVIFRVYVTYMGVTTMYEYSVLEFPGAETITRDQLARLSNEDYENRMDDFFEYIQSIHPNYVPDGSYKRYNPDCIVPVSTPTLVGEFDYSCVLEEHEQETVPDDIIYMVKHNDEEIYDGHNFGTLPFNESREIEIVNLSAVPIIVSTIKSSNNFILDNKLQSDEIPVGGSEFVIINYDESKGLIATSGYVDVEVVDAEPTRVYISFGGNKWWKFQRCAGYDPSECYMSEATKIQYEASLEPFNSGDRFYGAIEGDPRYLYTFTSQHMYSTTQPTCVITGVSRTDDTCP